jgi:hypothetical protein
MTMNKDRRPRASIVRGESLDRKNRKIEWARLENDSPKGIVFAPPLIGGSCVQQLNLLRWLGRFRFDVLSFNYSGHGNSTDKFSLRTSLENTLDMASTFLPESREHGPPLAGFAGCYSAIPLLFAAQKLGEPFGRIVLINPLTRLGPFSVLKSFFAYYRTLWGNPDSKKNLGEALHRYVDFLFPEVEKDRETFGVLKRHRTSLREVLIDFFLFSPLKGVTLSATPVLCLYAKRDRVIDVYEKRSDHYENAVRKICPLTRFVPMDDDHFLRSDQNRRKARKAISEFLSVPEKSMLRA